MCGFVAVHKKVGSLSLSDLNKVESCIDLIFHRGRDDGSSYSDESISFAFRRLSIQDITLEGRQPFISNCGRYVLAFNGEIYNFKELRSRLVQDGESFRSRSDTEVLCKLLIREGKEAVQKLRGMFAFVFWDKAMKELIVSRDRFGIKPIYFYELDEYLVFSSEIKCLIDFNGSLREENEEVSFRFLQRGFLDDSDQTFYRKINAFPKATTWVVKNGVRSEYKYWNIDRCIYGQKTFNSAEFLELLSTNIELHSVSCVPLSAALSGGIDSTTIVSLLKSNKAIDESFTSYTSITPGAVDESSAVDSFVQTYGLNQCYVKNDLTSRSAIDLVDSILVAHDEPIQQASTIDHYLLRKQASSDGYKVIFAGEGADELLAGYRRMVYLYILSLRESQNNEIYNESIHGATDLLNISVASVEKNLHFFENEMKYGGGGRENTTCDELFSDNISQEYSSIKFETMYPGWQNDNPSLSFKSLLINHLTKRNVPYVLRMEDRNSMHWGVESRVPFLDHVFVEYVLSHKTEEFMFLGENKSMLRRAMSGRLPNSILEKKTKINRPGSNSHFVYNLLKDAIFNGLNTFQSRFFKNNGRELLKHYEHDLSVKFLPRADFWFRLYIYMRWQKLFIKQVGQAIVKPI